MVDYVELAKQYNLSNDVDKILSGIKRALKISHKGKR